jgi:hypothetical protein
MKIAVLALALTVLLAACASAPVTHHSAGESWDQENLKLNDHGCPTAIFVAPNGELVQCGAEILHPYKAPNCWVDGLCTYIVEAE